MPTLTSLAGCTTLSIYHPSSAYIIGIKTLAARPLRSPEDTRGHSPIVFPVLYASLDLAQQSLTSELIFHPYSAWTTCTPSQSHPAPDQL